jgi:dihydroorotate dehydrogenase (NAD+) catalytic subunit
MENISIQLAPSNAKGLLLTNPVMTASGTFGYGLEYSELMDIQQLGAIVCKGTTLEPRDGNPQPRLWETSSGLLNSVGLQNIGVKAVIKEKAPVWAQWRVPVIVNIAGETVEEYAKIASELDGIDGVSAIEVNISCPNISSGGIEFGANPIIAFQVISAVKTVSSLPIVVKLSPNVKDIVEIALAVTEAGADALTVINTLRGMMIDIKAKKPSLGNVIGGLSGPAIKPVAIYMVYKIAGAVKIPIVGCGGIRSAEDALEFLFAGASAVQVGTANLNNPKAALEVLTGIRSYIQENGIKKLADIIGIARK